MRVPADSMSGVHALKFGGFTGRNGHGILLHSRTMRALGGADLDGDEAFVFFGGERKGFKKEWLDIFQANKEEFYTGKGDNRMVGDNKSSVLPDHIIKELKLPKGSTYRDLLTSEENTNEARKELLSSTGAMYSMTERMRISNAATQGRALLGSAAVSPKQVMALTHSIIANHTKKQDEFEASMFIKNAKGKKEAVDLRFIISPKTNKEWRDYARALGRAQVAFSSDPMDELGFKHKDVWFKELHKAHFNTQIIDMKTGKKSKYTFDDIDARMLRNGTYQKVMDIDSAFWGRNWIDNRRWTMPEIQERGRVAYEFSPSQQHNFMTAVARKLSAMDWSDSATSRVNPERYKAMYERFRKSIKNYPDLKKALGRASLKVEPSANTKAILKHELYRSDVLDAIADNPREFERVIGYAKRGLGTVNKKGGIHIPVEDLNIAINRKTHDAINMRKRILRRINFEGEDYFLNDINDMSTFYVISKMWNKMSKAEQARVPHLHKFSEKLKLNSYLMAIERNTVKEFDWAKMTPDQLNIVKEILANPELKELRALLPQHYKRLKKKRSAVLDRGRIDLMITKFRDNPGTARKPQKKLSNYENKMLDYLLMGTYRRGDLDAIIEFESMLGGRKKLTAGERDLLSYLKSLASKTGSSRLGWESGAVHPESQVDMIKPIVSLITKSFKPTPEKTIQKGLDIAEKMPEELVDEYGNKYLEDPMDVELQTKSGFEGLRNGVEWTDVPTNVKPVLKELIGHLKTQSPHFRQNFNEVVRYILGKEINTLTKYDYDVLNNWFRDIKAGTIFQRIFNKKQITKVAKRHHWLFPRTVNRELMRDGIELMEEKGMFVIKEGKVAEGTLQKPTHFLEMTRDWIARTNDSAARTSELKIQHLQQDLIFLNQFEDGEILRQIAVREREAGFWPWLAGKKGHLTKDDKINQAIYDRALKKIIDSNKEMLKK